ncbi:hypothetical protein [Candidatus Nanohalococcus occultus]|uniref:hypothetical protein n=1 Tax=Candidatus Nanohalococcus occultus TaxID=2978047 RepID=UPI0039E00D20
MKVEVFPTENPEQLVENLEKRAETAELKDGKIEVETDSYGFLEKVPGIEKFEAEGNEHMGLGGKPVEKQVYAKIESKEDAVECLLATVEGYDLRILNTGRDWDLRKLKKFNPDIKHLKFDEPREEFGIEKALFETDSFDQISVEMPEKEEVLKIYRELLT